MQTRQIIAPIQIRELAGDGITAIGYAAVCNQLSADLGGYRERLRPGAFRRSLDRVAVGEHDIFALAHHNPERPLGSISDGSLHLSEDGYGLRFRLDLPNTTDGRDLRELITNRTLRHMSFGFTLVDGEYAMIREGGELIQEHRTVDLHEISFCLWPAYGQTMVTIRGT